MKLHEASPCRGFAGFPHRFWSCQRALTFCLVGRLLGSRSRLALTRLVGPPCRLLSASRWGQVFPYHLVGLPCATLPGFPNPFSPCLRALSFVLVGLSTRLAFSAHFVDLPFRFTLSAFVGQSLRRGTGKCLPYHLVSSAVLCGGGGGKCVPYHLVISSFFLSWSR